MEHVAWQEANEALDTVHQIAQILDTGLDKETLSILIALCESGVNPEVGDVSLVGTSVKATCHVCLCQQSFTVAGLGFGGKGA